ncbi:hypothetical protein [Streptomyces lomondensis]|uniref:ATP-binding cassette, subfamily B n=1 Tax=Streptomyces lomondensis TaxID=68229 RepID=A0ABQ2X2G0_9ACTN|nr:hypothetical protein [Streptomyces lomondensis]MCF0082581.1 hypothetical protein [Streptomyces lomondensis]GGW94776.1 hypothetical protein GCM10010383_25440 [Streptomyces lomondensis]
MEEGRVVERGGHAELAARGGRYAALHARLDGADADADADADETLMGPTARGVSGTMSRPGPCGSQAGADRAPNPPEPSRKATKGI